MMVYTTDHIDYWYFMFCLKLFHAHDHQARVAKLVTFAANWVANTYIFLLAMVYKMAAAWSAVFAIFLVTVAVSTYLHVVCHYFICLMSLFQGHVACFNFTVNPLSPNIHMQILQTDLYTFPYRMSKENLINDQSIFPFGDHFTYCHNLISLHVWILLEENWFWSLLGLKGLRKALSTFWKTWSCWFSLFCVSC